MKQSSGFIYIWFDRKRKMYYIGSHLGSEADGYICSSNRMRNVFKRRSHDFKRKIIEKFQNINRVDLLIKEQKWLNYIKESELGIKYYNLKKCASGGPIRNGMTHTEETKRKMSLAHKGKKLSEESRENLRIKNKGKKLSEEHKAKIKDTLSRYVWPEERREQARKIFLKNKDYNKPRGMNGKLHSEETKLKMSNSQRMRYANTFFSR